MFNKINQLFVSFDRKDNQVEDKPDYSEKIGDFGLGFLRIGAGDVVSVKQMTTTDCWETSKVNSGKTFKKDVYNIALRITALAIFILGYQIFLPLAVIGCLGTFCSGSHGKTFTLYDQIEQRKKNSRLPTDLFLKSYPICREINSSKDCTIQRAVGGKTKVYLPKDVPEVVLKLSGQSDAIKRLDQMFFVGAILDSQNSMHLVIPKAKRYENFLVEDRLPINVNSYYNMELYLSNLTLFDDAIRELTRLFSKVPLTDLVSWQKNPLGHIPEVEDFVRYDNLPLYIEGKGDEAKGKIGLIDLEHIKENPESKDFETLARIFPYHLDIIKEEAKNLKMTIDEESLKVSAEKGKKYLQVGYADHLNWLKKKNITPTSNYQVFELNSSRMEAVATLVEKELLKFHVGVNDIGKKIWFLKDHEFEPGLLKENPEELAKELAPIIVALIVKNIQDAIEASRKDKPSTTESEMISLRSPILKRAELYKGVFDEVWLKAEPCKGLDDEYGIQEQLLYVVAKELMDGGEIFCFDPGYYTYCHEECWIRY